MDFQEFDRYLQKQDRLVQKRLISRFVSRIIELEFSSNSARSLSKRYFPEERDNFISYLRLEQRANYNNLQKFVKKIPIDFNSYKLHVSNSDVVNLEYIGDEIIDVYDYLYIDSSGCIKNDIVTIYRNKSIDLSINRRNSVLYKGVYSSQKNSKNRLITYLQFSHRLKNGKETLNRSLVIIEGDLLNPDEVHFKGIFCSSGLDAGRCFLIRSDPSQTKFEIGHIKYRNTVYKYLFNSTIRKEEDSNEYYLLNALSERSYFIGNHYGVAIEYKLLDNRYIPTIIILELTIGNSGIIQYISPNTGENIGYLDFFDRKREAFNFTTSSLPKLESNTSFELLIPENQSNVINGYYYTRNEKADHNITTTGKILLLKESSKKFKISKHAIELKGEDGQKDKTLNYLLEKYQDLADFLLDELSHRKKINSVKVLLFDTFLNHLKRYLANYNIHDGKYLMTIDNAQITASNVPKVSNSSVIQISNGGTTFKCNMPHTLNENLTFIYSGSIQTNKDEVFELIGNCLELSETEKKLSTELARAFVLVLSVPTYSLISNAPISGSIIWQNTDKTFNAFDRVTLKKISE